MTTPDTNPTVYPTLIYRDAHAAIAFLTEAFGFGTVAVHEGPENTVTHAELTYGNGMVMISSAAREGEFAKIAGPLGPASIYVVVQDTDKHHARAAARGAEIVLPITDQDYGSRDYTARDPEGNLWSFGTYLPTLSPQR